MRRVRVEPDHPPSRRQPFGEQIYDSARSTANIDRAVAWPQADPVKQRRAIGRQLLGLTQQARALALTAPHDTPRSGPRQAQQPNAPLPEAHRHCTELQDPPRSFPQSRRSASARLPRSPTPQRGKQRPGQRCSRPPGPSSTGRSTRTADSIGRGLTVNGDLRSLGDVHLACGLRAPRIARKQQPTRPRARWWSDRDGVVSLRVADACIAREVRESTWLRAAQHAVPLVLSQPMRLWRRGRPTIGAAVDGRNTSLPDTPTGIRFSSQRALLVVREAATAPALSLQASRGGASPLTPG
jgi:hypothetical protein